MLKSIDHSIYFILLQMWGRSKVCELEVVQCERRLTVDAREHGPYLSGLETAGSLVPTLFSADTRNSYSTSGSRSSTV